jgi:hypothetical protein
VAAKASTKFLSFLFLLVFMFMFLHFICLIKFTCERGSFLGCILRYLSDIS